jgi:dTDP-4-amino-4,6-dideoxygalactose transaminase
MDVIKKLATARSIPVVEDACQAHGAEWRGMARNKSRIDR